MYNENYINKNMRLQEEGLDTIVMLGEQVELDDIINQLKKDYDNNKLIIEQVEKNCQNFKTIKVYYVRLTMKRK